MLGSLRINLVDVSVSFRMSYNRTESIAGAVSEGWRRLAKGWKPKLFSALKSVSLSVRDGEVIGVIGPNGSGKSTLLRTISGIYHPDSGIVQTQGRVSALLSLGTGFDTRLNGYDNIRLLGLIQGLSLQEIEDVMPTIVEFADIGDHIEKPMKYYSTGMISRLGFSMILAMEPDILLIDETLSVGDLAFQEKSKEAMRRMMKRARCQVIVSHSLDFVERTCSRVIWINAGRIVADGEPSFVIKAYQESAEQAAGRSRLTSIKTIV